MSTSWVCERGSIISFTSRRHCSRSWPAQFRKSLRNNKSADPVACALCALFLSGPIVITPARVRGSIVRWITRLPAAATSSESSSRETGSERSPTRPVRLSPGEKKKGRKGISVPTGRDFETPRCGEVWRKRDGNDSGALWKIGTRGGERREFSDF